MTKFIYLTFLSTKLQQFTIKSTIFINGEKTKTRSRGNLKHIKNRYYCTRGHKTQLLVIFSVRTENTKKKDN